MGFGEVDRWIGTPLAEFHLVAEHLVAEHHEILLVAEHLGILHLVAGHLKLEAEHLVDFDHRHLNSALTNVQANLLERFPSLRSPQLSWGDFQVEPPHAVA